MPFHRHHRKRRRLSVPRLGLGAFACLFLWPAAGGLLAEETNGDKVRLLIPQQAIALALANNPDLAVAELEIARAKSRLRWSGRLDNPELEITGDGDAIGRDDRERSLAVAFTQSFPLTSRLRDKRGVRRAQVLLAEAEVAERRRQLAYQVDQTTGTVQATRAKLFVASQQVDLNTGIVEILRPLVARGEASPLDVTQTELTGRSLKQIISALEALERQQALQLARLLGIDPSQQVRIKHGLQLPLTQPTPAPLSDEQLFQRRPDHLLALAQGDVARAEALLANAERWEDISLKVFIEREQAVDDPNGLERNTFAGIGVSIPLPIRQRNENAIEQARIDIEAAEKARSAREFHIRSDYEAALQATRDAHALAAEASGAVIELAEKNLADFRDAYEKGQASLLQVQRAQEQVLELHNASLDLVAAYHRAEAQLRFVSGNYPGLRDQRSRADK